MNQFEEADLTTKVLAVLGSVALGFTALINAVLGVMALLSGHIAGAVGDVSQHEQVNAQLTTDAHHMALVAKCVAIGFGVLAAAEFGAGEFLRRRLRNVVVPIACGMTIAGELAFSIWSKRFNGLDAAMILCAVFAFWTWYRLPRATRADSRFGLFQSA